MVDGGTGINRLMDGALLRLALGEIPQPGQTRNGVSTIIP